jgi:hypothetical protein
LCRINPYLPVIYVNAKGEVKMPEEKEEVPYGTEEESEKTPVYESTLETEVKPETEQQPTRKGSFLKTVIIIAVITILLVVSAYIVLFQ